MERKPMPLFVCFVLPSLILAAGLTAAGYYGFGRIPELIKEHARGMLPRGFETSLSDPATYTVWLSVPEAEADSISPESLPPGGRLYIFDANSGRELPLSQWVPAVKYAGGEKSVSIGSFQTLRSDQKVEFKGTGFEEPFEVSIAPANTKQIVGVVLSVFVIVCVSLTVAITALIALLHYRQRRIEASLGHVD
ncbi:MAG: hypothetical protein AAGA96_02225 [Verrucomicrobiota bacterium]